MDSLPVPKLPLRYKIAATFFIVILAFAVSASVKSSIDTATARSAFDNQLCVIALNSWNARVELIKEFTAPTVLTPAVKKLFPGSSSKSLELQIASSNANKAKSRKHLLKLNGPKPEVCT